MTDKKYDIHPNGCSVRVIVHERPDRYIADFFDKNDDFMFTVDMARNSAKRREDFL